MNNNNGFTLQQLLTQFGDEILSLRTLIFHSYHNEMIFIKCLHKLNLSSLSKTEKHLSLMLSTKVNFPFRAYIIYYISLENAN